MTFKGKHPPHIVSSEDCLAVSFAFVYDLDAIELIHIAPFRSQSRGATLEISNL